MTVIVDPADVDLDAGIIIAQRECSGHCGPNMDCTGVETGLPAWVAEYDKPCETCDGTGLDLSADSIMATFSKRMDGAPAGTVGVRPCTPCRGSGRAVFQIGYRCETPLATVSITEVLPITADSLPCPSARHLVQYANGALATCLGQADGRRRIELLPSHPPAEPGDLAVFVTVHERHDR